MIINKAIKLLKIKKKLFNIMIINKEIRAIIRIIINNRI